MRVLPDPSPGRALFCVLWRPSVRASKVTARLAVDRVPLAEIRPGTYAVADLAPGIYLMSSEVDGKQNALGVQLVAGYTYYAEIFIGVDMEVNYRLLDRANELIVLGGLTRLPSALEPKPAVIPQ
ncbi:MAG: hypothetical protein EOM25_01925 [Deltaproteobacteria bacterium]|nr:hypothetical protein [Deltaproteobacteria bacterium]